MVGESEGGAVPLSLNYKNVPSSLQTKPFKIQAGQHHHLEKFDSQDSVEDDLKEVKKKQEELHALQRKQTSRLEEIKSMKRKEKV